MSYETHLCVYLPPPRSRTYPPSVGQLKPYVARTVFLSDQELLKETRRMTDRPQYWAAGMGPGGLSPERYLDVLTQNQGMVRPPELQTLEMRREKRRRQVAKRAALREDKAVAAISEKMSTVTV